MRPLWLVLGVALAGFLVASPGIEVPGRVAASLAGLAMVAGGRPRSVLCAAIVLGAVSAQRLLVPVPAAPATERMAAIALDATPEDGRASGWARVAGAAPVRVRVWGLDDPELAAGARLQARVRTSDLLRRPTPDRRSAVRGASARDVQLGLRTLEIVKVLDPGREGWLPAFVRRVSRDLDARLGPAAALWRALVLADGAALDRAARERVQSLGMAHLLALSGMHTSIVAGALLWPLRRKGRRALVAVLPPLAAWVVLAGGGASLVRAVGMVGWWVVANRRGVRADVQDGLAAVALLELTLRPHLLCGVGWWLSYVATLAVVRTAKATAGWPKPLAAIAISMGAQAATAPWIIDAFGFVNVAAPVTLLLVAPVFAAALVVGMGTIAVAALLPALAAWTDPIAVTAAHAFGAALRVVRPGAGFVFPARGLDGSDWVVAGAAVAACLWPGGIRPRVALACVSLGLLLCTVRPEPRHEWVLFDVGQGDASVLRCGEACMVVDAGPRYTDVAPAAWTVVDWLDRRRADDVTVVLTHAHLDHTGGLATLLATGRVDRVVLAQADAAGAWAGRVREAARIAGVQVVHVAAGDTLRLGRCRLEVLWPSASADDLPANDRSVVLGWRAPPVSLLLPGDLERSAETVLSRALDGPAFPWLKVAHHGGDTGTDMPWLERLGVTHAFVSTGTGNRYGHPHPEVLRRLDRAGARVHRTDECGYLRLRWSGPERLPRFDCGRSGHP